MTSALPQQLAGLSFDQPPMPVHSGAITGPPDQQSAWSILQSYFQQIGITDPSAISWAQGLVTSGASSAQVEVQMYDQPWFQQRFPQIAEAQKNGLPPISVADVLNYEQTVSQLEQQVGLPQGFVSKADIADLMGKYNVSATEFTDRLSKGFAASQQAVANQPELQQTLQKYYGVGPGGLAAYWLDPTKALDALQNQFSAAQIGAAGQVSGFGSVDRTTAQQLASLGVSEQQARTGFQTLAHMNQAFNLLPGERGQGVTQSEQIAGQFEGNAADQQAMQLAAARRQAAFQGGSNYTETAAGAAGLGAAVPNR